MANAPGRSEGWITKHNQNGIYVIHLGGNWLISEVVRLNAELSNIEITDGDLIEFNAEGIHRIDVAGAWTIHRNIKYLRSQGIEVLFKHADSMVEQMLIKVAENDNFLARQKDDNNSIISLVEQIGRSVTDVGKETVQLINFLGEIIATIGRVVINPWRLRVIPLVHHVQDVGLNALPIVGLISLLIGVVLAYQGASQLQKFGAEVFVVDLISISILREIGILLTAIVIAGRSGSAFTAQIGSMKVNEEIAAMQTLGLDPIEVLVLPRVFALVFTLPILAFFSDIVGLFGGALTSWFLLGISPGLFLERLHSSLGPWTFWIGIIKAPVFAFIIAMLGCFEGFQVEGSSESVGNKTTRAVVESIFLVIVIDAIFSIFFAYIGI